MSKSETERRCKTCGKRLLDEKLPFCKRCILEGRNKAGQIGGILTGAVLTVFSAKQFLDSNSSDDMDNSDEQD